MRDRDKTGLPENVQQVKAGLFLGREVPSAPCHQVDVEVGFLVEVVRVEPGDDKGLALSLVRLERLVWQLPHDDYLIAYRGLALVLAALRSNVDDANTASDMRPGRRRGEVLAFAFLCVASHFGSLQSSFFGFVFSGPRIRKGHR